MIHCKHGIALVIAGGTAQAYHREYPGPVDFEYEPDGTLLVILAPRVAGHY